MPEPKNAIVPPPPPDDLAARCRATIPVSAHPAVRRQPTRRRLLTVTVGAAMVAALTVAQLARPPRTPYAAPSPNSGVAFAETVRAMQRVTYFHRTGTGLNVQRTPQWKYLSTKFKDDEWFDVQRGLYEQTSDLSGIIDFATLTLPDGQLYIRLGAYVMSQDHSQRAQWSEVKRSKIREITDPSAFGNGIGSVLSRPAAPAIPSAFHVALWQGDRTLCFTFLAPPVKETTDLRRDAVERAGIHKLWSLVVPKDAPTLLSDVYVDPNTHRIRAVQTYARFSTPSTQPELLICQYTYDYAHRPDDAPFRPSTILKGAKEIDDFRESHGKETPLITHPHVR